MGANTLPPEVVHILRCCMRSSNMSLRNCSTKKSLGGPGDTRHRKRQTLQSRRRYAGHIRSGRKIGRGHVPDHRVCIETLRFVTGKPAVKKCLSAIPSSWSTVMMMVLRCPDSFVGLIRRLISPTCSPQHGSGHLLFNGIQIGRNVFERGQELQLQYPILRSNSSGR